jgi:radical SAM protein with 4Fe4S-binding SPASM domain
MGQEKPALDMSRETFLDLIAWLKKAPFNGNVVHLMGGEPTLHADFVWMAETTKANNFEIAIFTNAATPKAPEYAAQLKRLEIRWVVNVNPPESRTPEQDNNLRNSLRILADRVTLTFNMTPEPVPNEWLLDLIFEYNLRKKIKVGFVLPALSHNNQHLSKEDYPRVAERVVEFASRCETFGVSLEYECGIPWCAFTADQLGKLWHLNSKFHSTCYSILDITPDGHIVYCLPLATLYAVPFHQFENYPAAKKWYESVLTPYRPLGSTPHCFSCNLMRSGICRGGCLARVLQGTHNIKIGDVSERESIPIG